MLTGEINLIKIDFDSRELTLCLPHPERVPTEIIIVDSPQNIVKLSTNTSIKNTSTAINYHASNPDKTSSITVVFYSEENTEVTKMPARLTVALPSNFLNNPAWIKMAKENMCGIFNIEYNIADNIKV